MEVLCNSVTAQESLAWTSPRTPPLRADARPRGSWRAWRLSAPAYVLIVIAVDVIAGLAGLHARHALAASPDRVADGQWWTVFSSALIVDRLVLLQLAVLAVLATALSRRRGARTFWLSLLGGHVGSTLIAYGGMGSLWVTGRNAYANVYGKLDFGISCVWMALLATVAADQVLAIAQRHGRDAWWLLATGTASCTVVLLATVADLATVEHILAVMFGITARLVCRRPPHSTTLRAQPS